MNSEAEDLFVGREYIATKLNKSVGTLYKWYSHNTHGFRDLERIDRVTYSKRKVDEWIETLR